MKDIVCNALLDHTTEIVIAFDKTGAVNFGNRSALEKLEYTEEGIRERNVADFFRQEFQQADGTVAVFDVEKLLDKDESVMYREKGTCFPVSLRTFEPEEGKYFLLAEDITWQKDMDLRIRNIKEEEKKNLQMKDEFTANVTHELRTPINGIRGHVLGIIEEVTDPELKKALDMILFCCDNSNAIINNILDFSKLEANKFVIEEREFDFYGMMDKVIEIHMPAINKKELGMNVTVNEAVPQFVIGDSLRISQILNNLLSNAVKFTKIGKITVDVTKTYQNRDQIELFFMVRDTGIGISKEEQDKLFQSFVQVDASVSRTYGGTGLGLFITKQLIELMGGTIRLDSEKGKGSCFSFNIKLHVSEAQDNVQDSSAEIHNSWTNLIENEEKFEDKLYVFGSKENRKEIQKRMDKLALSIELGSWDRADMLTDTLKALVGGSREEFRSLFLRLEMAIRKENYDRCIESYNKLLAAVEEQLGGQ